MLVENGTGLFAAVESVGFERLEYMESYNVSHCAALCAATRECVSFNVCMLPWRPVSVLPEDRQARQCVY
jgi:hypothetical protein